MESDEITTAMDSTSTKITNTIVTNVTSATSINCHSKKVRDCYIVLIVVILLLLFAIIVQNKKVLMHKQYKMRNNRFHI